MSASDLEDPVEVLAAKCNEAYRDADAAVQPIFPLYHFEKSGEQHAPLWVGVVSLDNRLTSGDCARRDVCLLRVLIS